MLRDIEGLPEAERIRGQARFVNDHTLEVDGHTRIASKSIVIATGSRADTLDSYQGLGERLIINDVVFNWHDLPRAVAVIGPGIIGLELGQALHRLGVEVAVLGRGGRVGPLGDPEILAYAIATFSEEFVLEPDAHIVSLQRNGERVAMHRTAADGAQLTEYFDFVLAATGRTPQCDGNRSRTDHARA